MEPSAKVECPQIAECPVSLECRVEQKLELGSHVMFLASIQCLRVSEQYISPNGRLMMEKMNLLAYAHGSYYELGKALGSFGFSVRKKVSLSSVEAHPKEALTEKLEQHRRYRVQKKAQRKGSRLKRKR